ncbi:MAG: fluoride efflux transporter FluC [Candidatus Puniceispirillaceae bacterium]
MTLSMLAAVGAGGAIGAMARYGVAQFVGAGLFGMAGPLATLIVNVAGSAMMGGIAGVLAAGFALPEAWRGFIAVGFLGALTTFSSFALDTGQLAARQGAAMAAFYVGLSVLLSLAAFFAMQAVVGAFMGRMPT